MANSIFAAQTMPMSLLLESMMASIVASNLVNWLLHGVLTVQLYLYYLAFPNDRTRIKVAVYAVYLIETIQVIGLAIVQLLILVSGGTPLPISGYWTSLEYKWAAQALLITLLDGLVSLIAQCIYAHRIRIITQGNVIPRVIIALATLALVANILITSMPGKFSIMATCLSVSGLNIVNDLIITLVMVRSLSKEEPLSHHTRSKVIRLVRLIIATGSLTVAANILALIFLFIDAYIIGGWITSTGLGIYISKVYANSILVMLNNRMTVRNSQDVAPLNMISINALSTLVIADHRIGASGSAASRYEVPLSASVTRYSI